MLETIMWILLIVVVAYSIWYNYNHYKRLLSGKITLTELVIAVGSIGVAIILFILLVLVKIF